MTLSALPPPTTRERFPRSEVLALYEMPLLALVDRARAAHLRYHEDGEVQLCTL
jgi:hypothetical protein